MLERLRQFMRRSGDNHVAQPEARAADLAPLEPPKKLKNKPVALPSYVTNARQNSNASALPRNDRQLANTDALTFRTGADTRTVLGDLIASNPDLSASVFAYLRTAITTGYTAVGRNMDGSFNREATLLAQQILTRFDEAPNYVDGFTGFWTLRACSESLLKELLKTGSMASELVLDKARLPARIQPISTTQIEFQQDGNRLKPVQKVGSETIDLDIATFFYTVLDQDLRQPYSESPLEAAIQPVLADTDFFNDLRKLVKRALHPRLDVKINEEKFRKTIPQDVALDPARLKAHIDSVMAEIQSMVNDLNPEDALVHFDFIEFNFINHGNASPAQEEETLLNIARSRMAAGAKTMPSVLGHGTGAQNAASTETLLFMTAAVGAGQMKLNEHYSKKLTLAVRLFGLDCYVEFKYAPVDLRPANELEAFRTMKQERVLELLSLGFIGDDEAAIELTGNVAPTGFTPLSGTRFKDPSPAGVAGNPYSTTGAQGNKQGALNQSLKPETPTNKKS